MVDILILGATGVTGRLTTRYLHEHPQRRPPMHILSSTHRPFTIAISGHSPSKLNELVISLGQNNDVEVIALDVSEYDELEETVKKAKVVISCMYPYWKWGRDVVLACAANGVHYIDMNCEPHFLYEIIRSYDYLAFKHRSIVIPSCGFYSLPSDVLVHVAASTMRKALARVPTISTLNGSSESPSALIASSQTSTKMNSASVSGRAFAAAFGILDEVPKDIMSSVTDADCLSPVKKTNSSRSLPSLIYTLIPMFSPRFIIDSLASLVTSSGRILPFGRWGSYSSLGSVNCNVVMRSWGLLEREVDCETVETTTSEFASHDNGTPNGDLHGKAIPVRTYGPSFTYDEFAHAKSPIRALLASIVSLVVVGCSAYFPPMRWLYMRIVPRREACFNDKTYSKASLQSVNITKSIPIQTDLNNKARPYVVKTTMEIKCDLVSLGSAGALFSLPLKALQHPFIVLYSKVMSAEAALALLDVPSLPPLAKHGGILTPATALGDVIVSRLTDCGLWEIKSSVVEHRDVM